MPVDVISPQPPKPSPRQIWLLDEHRSWPSDDVRRMYYHMSRALKLKPAVDVLALKRALGQVVTKHEALRWAFPTIDGHPTVRILESESFDIPVIDATKDDAEAFAKTLSNAATELFDLSNGPLFSVSIYILPEGASVILVRFHHLVIDEWSVALVVRDLMLCYFDQSMSLRLEAGGPAFSQYATWQSAFIASPEGERQLAYWRDKLCDAPPPLPLPFDRYGFNSYKTAFTIEKLFSPSVGQLLSNLVRVNGGTTTYRVLLGACMIALYAQTGVADAPVTANVSNRAQWRFRETVGWIANEIIFREPLDREETVANFIARLGDCVDEGLHYQEIPYHLILTAIERDFPEQPTAVDQVCFRLNTPARNGEFGYNFYSSQAPQTKISWGGHEIESVPLGVSDCVRDLEFVARVSEAAITVSLVCRGDVFSFETGQQILDLYAHVLAAMVNHPQETIAAIVERVNAVAIGPIDGVGPKHISERGSSHSSGQRPRAVRREG